LRGVFFSGERRACWRRREGVGGVLKLRRSTASMHSEVVEDGECTGGRGVAWGGVNRRLLPQYRRGIQRAIDGLWCKLERGSESRRSRRRRGATLLWRRERGNGSIYRNAG
jgi:hypothetical protein